MGVARALIAILEDQDVIRILVAEYGWDASFLAMAMMKGEDAQRVFGRLWEELLAEHMRNQVNPT
jgi:hypothetical protein